MKTKEKLEPLMIAVDSVNGDINLYNQAGGLIAANVSEAYAAVLAAAPDLETVAKNTLENCDLRTKWPEVYLYAKSQGWTGFLARFGMLYAEAQDALDKAQGDK